MLSPKDILADLHTHTIASVHAFSTLKENMEVAKSRGLRYIAVTDHFYCNLRGEQEFDQEKSRLKAMVNYKCTPETSMLGVGIITGAELNMFHYFKYPWVENLSWRPIGFHDWFFTDEPFDSFDRFMTMEPLMICDESLISVYAHPERGLNKLFYGEDDKYTYMEFLVNRAKNNRKPLEVNESSITNFGLSKYTEYWLKLAKDKDCKLSLGSDAHICFSVGDFTGALELLNKLDYPKELILNCDSNFLVGLGL